MSNMTAALALGQLPPATEALVRKHAEQIRAIANVHGVTGLKVASTGELVGHMAADKDLFDVAAFEVAVKHAIRAEVYPITDTVLAKDGIDPQLRDARPL